MRYKIWTKERKEEIKGNSLKENKEIINNQLVKIDLNDKEFQALIHIYGEAANNVGFMLKELKDDLRKFYGYDVINTITGRIKTQQSIISKMEKKHYDINYKNMVEYVNDIAGIRITCPLKSDIKKVKDLIEKLPNIYILEEKDYIKKPKKSGYSGLHLIIETPIKISGKDVPIKVELQIRTMAMDFWATTEHKMRYKNKEKISCFDSIKLSLYAKMLNIMDNNLSKISKKQRIKQF